MSFKMSCNFNNELDSFKSEVCEIIYNEISDSERMIDGYEGVYIPQSYDIPIDVIVIDGVNLSYGDIDAYGHIADIEPLNALSAEVLVNIADNIEEIVSDNPNSAFNIPGLTDEDDYSEESEV